MMKKEKLAQWFQQPRHNLFAAWCGEFEVRNTLAALGANFVF
jgi:hypothetical protein